MTEPGGPSPERPLEKETGRLEAFSDGVLAVIITITALELRAPAGSSFSDLRQRLPELLIYVLSFAFIGIYWNNHHHLLRAATRISAGVMWANLHLLFWLSLIPITTEWVGASYDHVAPAATYATVALGAALAFTVLSVAIIKIEGEDSKVARSLENNLKGRVSMATYGAAIGVAFLLPWLSYALLVAVAIMWFIPDRRLAEPAG